MKKKVIRADSKCRNTYLRTTWLEYIELGVKNWDIGKYKDRVFYFGGKRDASLMTSGVFRSHSRIYGLFETSCILSMVCSSGRFEGAVQESLRCTNNVHGHSKMYVLQKYKNLFLHAFSAVEAIEFFFFLNFRHAENFRGVKFLRGDKKNPPP